MAFALRKNAKVGQLLLIANLSKAGDAELRGYSEMTRHARRAASKIAGSMLAAFFAEFAGNAGVTV